MLDSSPCPPVPTFSFTQGVLLGQASFVVLAVIFLKYVVFEDPQLARLQPQAKADQRKTKRHRSKASLPTSESPIPALLSQLGYDLPTHPPETTDWLNVLLAQTLVAYRLLVNNSTAGNGGAKGLMEEMLNRKGNAEGSLDEGPDQPGLVGIDAILVSEVEVGDKFPVLSNARVRPSGGSGGVRVEVDLDYTDHVSLDISTCVVVNFPRPRFAVLPIRLGLTLERFSGTLTLELPSPLSSTASTIGHTHPTLNVSLHPDFTLDLSTTSLLGSRAKLQDVPKVEQLILARIRGWIQDRVVWPGRVQVALPGLERPETGPRTTTDGDQGGEQGGEGWEWVTEDEASVVHNADSDDGSNDGAEPTIDLDADGGPAVLLHPKSQSSPPPSSRAGPGSRLSSPPPADIAAHLSSFLAPLGCELEQGIAVRALTHKSVGETVNTGHNEKLAFMGRRILRLHLTLHLNTALAPFPDLLAHYVTQESIDLLLDTRELGAGAGAALQLERALRWREVRGPDGRPTGLFKSRGCALEAVVGAVYLTHSNLIAIPSR
ncbi:hypothetical protein RQP46_009340 [Phenoliferia psychrophenolica]